MGFQNIIKLLKSGEQNLNYRRLKQKPLRYMMYVHVHIYKLWSSMIATCNTVTTHAYAYTDVCLTSLLLKTATRTCLERTFTPLPGRGMLLAAITQNSLVTLETSG